MTVALTPANEWKHEFTGLPAVAADGTAYVYRAVEDESELPDSYAQTAYAVTAQKTTITNTVRNKELTVEKAWFDSEDHYDMRPTSILVQLERSADGGLNWSDVGTAATLEEDADGNWKRVFANLPLETKDAEGAYHDLIYRIEELAVPGYAAAGGAEEVDSATGEAMTVESAVALTNTLETVTISGRKVWDDQQSLYGTRPDGITITLLESGLAVANAPEPTWEVDATDATGSTWIYTYVGLPMYALLDGGGAKLAEYSVAETVPTGYEVSPAEAEGTMDADEGTVAVETITNSLITVSIGGTKTWADKSNAYGTRPTAEKFKEALTLYAGTDPVDPQPTLEWTSATGDSDSNWTYIYTGLPRYDAETGAKIVYSVAEDTIPQYYANAPQSGTAAAETGNVTGADFTNRLVRMLEIDNVTANPATAETDAGGFVAVDGTPDERDIDPYQSDEVRVQWQPDDYWEHDATITVRYLEHGEVAEWQSVTVPIDDIGALRDIPYFANAVIERSGDLITLTLAEDAEDMPYKTHVEVSFHPTLAVENTTRKDKGGSVKISAWSDARDGREPQVVAYGRAKSGYRVDLKNLQISVPLGVSGSVHENGLAVKIVPDAAGNFSANIEVEIAGVTQVLTVTGRVAVLKRDRDGNPIEVEIMLDNLPVSLDIGIPFALIPEDDDVPATGDPILWAVALLLVSGIGLVVFRRRRKVK